MHVLCVSMAGEWNQVVRHSDVSGLLLCARVSQLDHFRPTYTLDQLHGLKWNLLLNPKTTNKIRKYWDQTGELVGGLKRTSDGKMFAYF